MPGKAKLPKAKQSDATCGDSKVDVDDVPVLINNALALDFVPNNDLVIKTSKTNVKRALFGGTHPVRSKEAKVSSSVGKRVRQLRNGRKY